VPVAGSVEFHAADGKVWTLALLQAQVTNQGDAWVQTVDQLARLLEAPPVADADGGAAADAPVDRLQVLAQRVAELHLALAGRTGQPAFEPEPVEAADLHAGPPTVREECTRTLALLDAQRAAWSAPLAELLADQVLACEPALLARADRVAHAAPVGLKTRLHGDLHLGRC
jgi:maltose alpha-D-glucosyltransferase/alpha-amylase